MVNLIIAGDFVFLQESKHLDENSYESRFSDIKTIVENSDYSIVNLESPVIKGQPTPINKLGPNLYSDSKAFSLLRFLGFKGVTLANNHFFDQGDQGVYDTINDCNKYGIAYFGGGYNISDASQTKIITVKDKQIAIINCCEKEFSVATDKHGGSNPLNPIAQYYAISEARKQADYVIVIVHGGIEHFQYPTIRMQETYRFFIDAGATAVINHHQHCYSGYEIYNNSPIIYGLGNFFFPRTKYSNTFWNKGYLVRLILSNNTDIEIIPYNQCSDGVNISLLNTAEREIFDSKMANLCHVIAEHDELERVNVEFMDKSLCAYDWIFQSYKNKYLRALANKGILPKLLSQTKLDEVISLINCQAHFDRFNHYLHKRTSKDV